MIVPATKVALQILPGSRSTVVISTPRIRATLRKQLWCIIINHEIGYPEIDVVSGNESICRLRWMGLVDGTYFLRSQNNRIATARWISVSLERSSVYGIWCTLLTTSASEAFNSFLLARLL